MVGQFDLLEKTYMWIELAVSVQKTGCVARTGGSCTLLNQEMEAVLNN
jgi:hypothetical protein